MMRAKTNFFPLGNKLKATLWLRGLGQNLWLDNITRDLLDQGDTQTIHPRVVRNGTYFESDNFRTSD